MTDPVFDAAFAAALAHEGGYSVDPQDPGNWTAGKVGEGVLKGTKYGISAASYPELDIANLTEDAAKAIYYRDWWLKFGFGKVASASIAAKLFDAAINIGMTEAVICLQRALRAYGRPMVEDGNLGPVTLAALNSVLPYNFLPAFRSELAGHYRLVADRDKAEAVDLPGWLSRAYA